MSFSKAINKAITKSFEIEAKAYQTLMVNWLVKNLASFVKIYWILIIANKLFFHRQAPLFNNILSDFRVKVKTQTLTDFHIRVEIPFLNELTIQINIKNKNKNKSFIQREMNHIFKVLSDEHKNSSSHKIIKK